MSKTEVTLLSHNWRPLMVACLAGACYGTRSCPSRLSGVCAVQPTGCQLSGCTESCCMDALHFLQLLLCCCSYMLSRVCRCIHHDSMLRHDAPTCLTKRYGATSCQYPAASNRQLQLYTSAYTACKPSLKLGQLHNQLAAHVPPCGWAPCTL